MDNHSNVFAREGQAEMPDNARREPAGRVGEPRELRRPPTRRSWIGVVVWGVLLVAIVAAAAIYLPRLAHHRGPGGGGRVMSAGPIPVGVATAAKGDMPVTLSGLGTVTPLAVVTVKTQINGYLMSVGFNEGQHVKKGDFLAQVDPRPYQVALAQAQAQLAKDEAMLTDAELDLKRYNTLVAQNSIATQTRDTQIATVAQDRAQIMLDQAQINTQKLNLTYAHIISPVTGRVGLRQVDPGNYVQTSDPNGIVVVTQLQPISVIFTLPEDDVPQVLKQYHAGAVLPVTAYDRTGTTQLAVGRLDTIDNQIDPTTGTVKLRATFDNTDESLFPNQFVNIKLLVNTLHDTVLVPTAAIQRGAPGTFVYLVKPDHTVAIQTVKLGPGNGQQIAVLSGLDPGAQVVDDGADRLKDGAKITVAPAPGSAPTAGVAPPPGTTPAAGAAAATAPQSGSRHSGQGVGHHRQHHGGAQPAAE
ncbi:MAG TPA: MdtA/MuxA family multidrug efflux RND transporter periplasmic adaptor subunit [Stellaceae bacterium]|nr:MdtA/MuxA family multidrug efflux RND transporter periplasmic adaptor subunit [Stellaceae bacterium]